MIFRIGAAGLLLLAALSAAAEPLRVSASPLSEVSSGSMARAAAAVTPANESILASQVTGLVQSVGVQVADRVAKGDLLVQLDTTDFQLAVDQAGARLAAQDSRIAQAAERLRRARDLRDQNYASADELLARETEVAVLKADRQVLSVALDVARRELDKTRIAAPFDGVVTARTAQVGALATPGTPLVTLVQETSAFVVADVPPDQAKTLAGDPEAYFEAGGERWRLGVVSVSPVIDARRRVQTVRLEFVSDAAPAGQSGYLVWRAGQPMLGTQYILRRGERLGLFIAEDSRARFHALDGAQEGRAAAVDLPGSSLVITDGHLRLQDGDAVIISQ